VTRSCPVCGHEEPDDERFCGQCGSRLDGEPSSDQFPSDDDSSADDTSTDYYYTYTWFGERHSISGWRWALGVISLVVVGLFLGLVYASAGLWQNGLIITVTMLLAAWSYHIIGKRKYGVGALLAVTLLILAGMLLSSVPWQESQGEHQLKPYFTDTIGWTRENETHIICDGFVKDIGTTGGTATVEFKASGGFPEQGQDMLGGFVQGTVVTPWIAPNGGTAHVHWECNLTYFNAGGQVTWIVG